MIDLAFLRVALYEILTGILEPCPAGFVIIAVPRHKRILKSIGSFKIRLLGIEKGRCRELKNLALEGHRRSESPASGLGCRIGCSGITPGKIVPLYHGIQNVDHEIHGLLHRCAGIFI